MQAREKKTAFLTDYLMLGLHKKRFLHRLQALKHRITPKAESYTYRLAVFKKVGLFEHCPIDLRK